MVTDSVQYLALNHDCQVRSVTGETRKWKGLPPTTRTGTPRLPKCGMTGGHRCVS